METKRRREEERKAIEVAKERELEMARKAEMEAIKEEEDAAMSGSEADLDKIKRSLTDIALHSVHIRESVEKDQIQRVSA